MAGIDYSKTFYLTNGYTGSAKQLSSLVSAAIAMANSNGNTDEQWYFSAAELSGYYRLHTKAKGDGQSLDVVNDQGVNSKNLQFFTTGLYSGQFWRLDPWGNGTYRVSNSFTGLDKHLDVYSDTLQPHLAVSDATGQHWTFQLVTSASSSLISTSSSTTSSQLASTLSSDISSASTTGNTPSTTELGSSLSVQSNKGISTGAIVGAAIGGLIALALVVVAIVGFIYLRKRKKSEATDAYHANNAFSPVPMATGSPGMALGEEKFKTEQPFNSNPYHYSAGAAELLNNEHRPIAELPHQPF